MPQVIAVIHSSWSYLFNDLQLSSREFYREVESCIERKKLDDISFKRITFPQEGMFSARREYLRVVRKRYTFDICAAPYGTGFFISYWQGETRGLLRQLFAYVPFVVRVLDKLSAYKTYYQHDTGTMFRSTVHNAVQEAISTITTAKGLRALSPTEMQAKDTLKVRAT